MISTWNINIVRNAILADFTEGVGSMSNKCKLLANKKQRTKKLEILSVDGREGKY